MTRDEAVAKLRSFGLNAAASDWGGATISIPMGEPTTHGGITICPSVVYLYSDDAGWNLIDFDPHIPKPAAHYVDLASAVLGALEYVENWERARGYRQ